MDPDAAFAPALQALFRTRALEVGAGSRPLMLGFPDQGVTLIESRAAEQDGREDALLLAADYGGCSGPVMRRFYGNMKAYVRNPPDR